MSVFTKLEGVLRKGESLNFQIKAESGAWVVLIQPVLDGGDDAVPEAAKAIRASLSVPLLLRGNSAAIDLQFDELVSAYAQQRVRTGDAFNAALDALREGEKAAKSAMVKKGAVVKKTTPAPKSVAVDEAEDEAEDDDSLESGDSTGAGDEVPLAASDAETPKSAIAPTSNPDHLF